MGGGRPRRVVNTTCLTLAPGQYSPVVPDGAGGHEMEWSSTTWSTELVWRKWVDQPAPRTRRYWPVSKGVGTITDDPSGDPPEGAGRIANGPSAGIAGGSVTAADGLYCTMACSGTHRVTVADPNGGCRQEFCTTMPSDFGGAVPVGPAGGTVTVDAALALALRSALRWGTLARWGAHGSPVTAGAGPGAQGWARGRPGASFERRAAHRPRPEQSTTDGASTGGRPLSASAGPDPGRERRRANQVAVPAVGRRPR